jgi:hypothetical protein
MLAIGRLTPDQSHTNTMSEEPRGTASDGRAGPEMIESHSTLSRRRDGVGTVYTAAASPRASEASLRIAMSMNLKS